MDTAALAKTLADARRNSTKLEDYPTAPPSDITQAYVIQDAMAEAMDDRIVGWKIGLTSEVARQMLGVDEPFSGPLFDRYVQASPGRIPVSMSDLRIVEAEIGFRLKSGLEPRDQPYAAGDIADAIATVHPAFELVNKRLPGEAKDNGCWLIADGGLSQALVFGAGKVFDPAMNLASETVKVSVDGKLVTDGAGSNAMGNPLNVALWLANHLSDRNIGLKAGDWISTGLICDVITPDPGATIVAQFESIGTVTLELA